MVLVRSILTVRFNFENFFVAGKAMVFEYSLNIAKWIAGSTIRLTSNTQLNCKFKQVFWGDVPLEHIGIMFFRFNKSKQK